MSADGRFVAFWSYASNLVAGDTNGASDIPSFTSSGTSNYHSLQVQLNRRFGRRIMLGSNWTWQKTTTYAQNQYIPDKLMKNVQNRKQAVNINFTYAIPRLQ